MSKLKEEQAMTAEEFLALDDALEAQSGLGRLVHEMPDAEPSLAWRSSLNSRLMAMSPNKRRTSVWTWLSGGVAATALAASAIFALVPKSQSPEPPAKPAPVVQSSSGVEESLLTAHNDANLESGLGVAWTQEAPKSGS